MEVMLISREGEAFDVPRFDMDLTKPDASTKRIGWGEPWKPSICIDTGKMIDGQNHHVRIVFDNAIEVENFLRTQTARFFNPQGLWIGTVVPQTFDAT